MSRVKWTLHSTPSADRDVISILRWTNQTFGTRQRQIYETTLLSALHALREDPNIIGVKKRDDLALGVYTLHIARNGRKGRHFIVFRVNEAKHSIEVLRLLHDSMDLEAHVRPVL